MAPPTCLPCLSARLKQELDVKQHRLGLLRQRIAGSESAQLAEAVKASEQELAEAKEAAAAAQQKRKDMVKAAKVCQNDGSSCWQHTGPAQV